MDYLFKGLATKSYVYSYRPEHPGYDPDWAWYPLGLNTYDPEKAVELLAGAGYDPSDIHVNMILAEYAGPLNVPLSEAIGMYWEQIGIQVEYETLDFTTFMGMTNKRQAAGYAWGWLHNHPNDPTQYYRQAAHSDNYLGWGFEDTDFDVIVEAMEAEIDDAKRAELFHEAGQYIYDGSQVIPLCLALQPVALSSKIEEWVGIEQEWSAQVTLNLEFIKLVR